jgi:hypothetical protein
MPLEETIDTLEGIDEKYKDLYIENDDGKFEINISGLKSALAKERGLKKALEKKVAALDVGDEPDIESLKNELKAAKDTINNMNIRGTVKSAALKAGVDPEYVDDVMTLTQNKFKVDETGDIIMVGNDGEPTGKSVDAFFKNDFKRSKPRYFNGSGRSGSGSHGSDVTPTSFDGRINKAIQEGNFAEVVKLKQSKINNK